MASVCFGSMYSIRNCFPPCSKTSRDSNSGWNDMMQSGRAHSEKAPAAASFFLMTSSSGTSSETEFSFVSFSLVMTSLV